MPLLVHVVFWWIVGLAIGGSPRPEVPSSGAADFSALLSWRWLTMAVVAICWLVLVRRTMRGALRPGKTNLRVPSGVWLTPCFAIGGWLASRAALGEQQSCRTLLVDQSRRGQQPWLLIDDVTVGASGGGRGALVRGEARESQTRARCHVRATVRWFGVPPTPGALVHTPGLVTSTARGLRIEQRATAIDSGAVNRSASVDRLRAWRGHLGSVIDERFRSRAPLVRALLIADQDGLDHTLRERYADAGLVHMLSVSGMHVAIIASALITLGGMARVPRTALDPIALAFVTAYVLLIGAPAPAVRSAVMLAVVTLAARWQRPVHEWTALALGATVPTIDPLVVLDLGYQLSVGGMAALVGARAARRRWKHWARHGGRQHGWHEWLQRAARWRGWRGWLLAEILTGVVATLITAPLIAWTFGRISVIAPVSNLAAAPIVGVLQPALFVALAWAMAWSAIAGGGDIAGWLPDATQPLMAMLDVVADVSARVPGAVVPVAPTFTTACGLGIVCAILIRASASDRARSWILCAAVVACLTVWTEPLRRMGPAWLLDDVHLEMHVLDVGQGDAVALRTPRGRWVIVDAGPRWQGGDAGRRTVVPHVRRYGGDVALFVLSHAHDDHAGGAASVVDALRPLKWWESAFVGTSPGYRDALGRVAARNVVWERVRPGQQLELDGVHFTVLAPDSAWTAAQHDANETSVVIRAEFGAHRFLLTGDAEHDEESWLVQHYTPDDLAADVLKVGHHGSRTSSTPAFLDAVRPRVAVVSLGAGNRYGHPATQTLQAFLDRTIPVLRTDLEGVVIVRSDGRTLTVESRGERWTVPDTLLHVFHR